MDKHAQDLHEAHEDERIRYFTAKRAAALAAAHDEQVRADERRRMTERADLEDRVDITGFSPGARGMI